MYVPVRRIIVPISYYAEMGACAKQIDVVQTPTFVVGKCEISVMKWFVSRHLVSSPIKKLLPREDTSTIVETSWRCLMVVC